MKAPDKTHVASAAELGDVTWQKAKKSGGGSGGGCAELAALPDGTIGLRNSRNPNGPALLFTLHEIECLLDGARNGEFDHLI